MQIVCVDRNPWSLENLSNTVKCIAPDATIHSCRNPAKAMEIVRIHGCDILLTEIDFGSLRWEGIDFAEEIQKINQKVNIIFVTDLPEREYAQELIKLRISGYVRKPYEVAELAEEFAHLRY